MHIELYAKVMRVSNNMYMIYSTLTILLVEFIVDIVVCYWVNFILQ